MKRRTLLDRGGGRRRCRCAGPAARRAGREHRLRWPTSPSRHSSRVRTTGCTWRSAGRLELDAAQPEQPGRHADRGKLGLRDPFVLRKQDGTFVVLATDLNGTNFGLNNQYLHVWDSTNLTGFTGYRRIQMHTLATHTWAPTAFWDAARGQYGIVYSAVNGGRDLFQVNYTGGLPHGRAPQIFFNPGFGVLDGDIVGRRRHDLPLLQEPQRRYLYGARSSTGAPNSFSTYTGGLGRAPPSRRRCCCGRTTAAGGYGATRSPGNDDYYPGRLPRRRVLVGDEPARLHAAAERQARVDHRNQRHRVRGRGRPLGHA